MGSRLRPEDHKKYRWHNGYQKSNDKRDFYFSAVRFVLGYQLLNRLSIHWGSNKIHRLSRLETSSRLLRPIIRQRNFLIIYRIRYVAGLLIIHMLILAHNFADFRN